MNIFNAHTYGWSGFKNFEIKNDNEGFKPRFKHIFNIVIIQKT